MKKLILTILLLFPGIAFSTTVLPSCDILFYNNDTLFIEKIHSDIILRKLKKQPTFNYRDNPVAVNRYTAYWEIENNKIYLLKITNRKSYSWEDLKQSDSLDLKKTFGNKYQDGKVAFKTKNSEFILHKPYVLRRNWAWYPTYIEDYSLVYKNNKLLQIDTIKHYVNNESRLNRYAFVQLEEMVFKLITDSLKQNLKTSNFKTLKFSVNVIINNDGSFNTVTFSNGIVTDFSGNQFEKDSVENYLLTLEPIINVLKSTLWDEIQNIKKDVVRIEYEYSFITRELTYDRFKEHLVIQKQLIDRYLPWYIRKEYKN